MYLIVHVQYIRTYVRMFSGEDVIQIRTYVPGVFCYVHTYVQYHCSTFFVVRTYVCCHCSMYVCMYMYTYVCYYHTYSTYLSTVKPVYKDHPRDQVIVVFVDRWSLCRGAIVLL